MDMNQNQYFLVMITLDIWNLNQKNPAWHPDFQQICEALLFSYVFLLVGNGGKTSRSSGTQSILT